MQYGLNEDEDVSVRVVADHARASAFLVGDGVLPSNEGRGYVLRRIMRRAARHGKLLGLSKPFLHDVAMQVITQMEEVYPELRTRKDFINKVILNEEERFLKTLDRGLSLLDEVMAELKNKGESTIPGDTVFMLYDTFGFPVDLTQDIAVKKGFTLDNAGFEAQMEIQREKARTSSSFADASGEGSTIGSLVGEGSVRFVGYDVLEVDGTVLELSTRTEGGYVQTEELVSGDQGVLISDVTPFYGESGGQVGDTGRIIADGLLADVVDTTKSDSGLVIHHIMVTAGVIRKGQKITLAVDRNRRRSIMRHHSATHLLQRALRDVLGDHVHQSGSSVDESRLRFDFTHFAPLSQDEIDHVEDIVNRYVLDDLAIDTRETSKEEAMAKGAMALFDEKYGDKVRLVSMGEASLELCGGTHCSSTGQIGMVKVVSEGSVSAGLRRIEAIAGTKSLGNYRNLSGIIAWVTDILRCSPTEIDQRISSLLARIKEQEGIIKDLNIRIATGSGSKDAEQEYSADGLKVVIKQVDTQDIPQIREVGDRIKDRIGTGLVLLYAIAGGKATFIAMATPDAISRLDAGKIMKEAMDQVGGRGGGKSQFAQGGADEASVEAVINVFKESAGGK